MILLRGLIQGSIVHTHSPLTIFLGTITNGETHSLFDIGEMNPALRSFWSSSLTISLRLGFILLWGWKMG
jgi:hypothetical protein